MPHRLTWSDTVLPACLAVLAVVEIVAIPALAADPEPSLITTLAMTIGLVWRRAAPLPSTGVVAACFAAYPLLAPHPTESLIQALALLVAAYAIGAYAPIRPGLAGTAVVVVAGVVRSLLMDYDVGSVAVNSLWGLLAWAVGRAMHRRDRRARMAQLAVVEGERMREAGEREAVAAERRRIARELHDVVAHAVTVIVVQARGARRCIDTDPEQVRRALDAIEDMGSDAIDELRRMLALLGDPDQDGDESEVRSGPAELEALVHRVAAAGLPVTLQVTGAPTRHAASIDVSAYRVVQEALTNALRHGGGTPARVTVTYRADGIDVRVDSGNGTAGLLADAAVGAGIGGGVAGTGRGLVGLRERVRLTGGTLHVGADGHGRHTVHAVLPFDGQPS
ncbi:sensor histidine kinase [Micromonospora inositola]|uniref:sensor histidine kinase n=1 Tax=Micromonospora inositola TaxID=47865 RepID=UPI0012FD6697|nr:histidine kinase [Micromonospora inositola]